MRIGINCGHTVDGQPGSGAVGRISESTETRNVGKKLIALLKQAGHTVYDCTNDYAPSTSSNLSQIVDMANRQPLDLFVSIHFNSGGGRGTEVFTYGAKQHTEAVNVCKALESLGFKNRGVKDGSNLYVVRRSDAKAMLVEVCFVDTDDADKYKQLGADKVAQTICNAITGESEDLTMTQYEDLKNQINELQDRVAKTTDSIAKQLQKLTTPFIYNYIDDNMPEWAREAVQWCVDNGIIQGTGEGLGLDDTKLWLCTVIHRLAKQI